MMKEAFLRDLQNCLDVVNTWPHSMWRTLVRFQLESGITRLRSFPEAYWSIVARESEKASAVIRGIPDLCLSIVAGCTEEEMRPRLFALQSDLTARTETIVALYRDPASKSLSDLAEQQDKDWAAAENISCREQFLDELEECIDHCHDEETEGILKKAYARIEHMPDSLWDLADGPHIHPVSEALSYDPDAWATEHKSDLRRAAQWVHSELDDIATLLTEVVADKKTQEYIEKETE